jgi:hypothetical protein
MRIDDQLVMGGADHALIAQVGPVDGVEGRIRSVLDEARQVARLHIMILAVPTEGLRQGRYGVWLAKGETGRGAKSWRP